jgi:membrane fusion protein (multidrug efflux system)
MADVDVRSEQEFGKSIPSSNPKRPSRTKALLIFLCIAALVAVGIWVYNKQFVEGFESTDDAKIQGNQAIISSQALGQIRNLAVDLGETVSKGQVLATLDDSSQRAQRDQVLYAIAQAQLDVDQARISITNGLANVQLSQVKLQQAKGDFDRATSQLSSAVISQEQFEHVKSTWDSALAAYNIAAGQQRLADGGEKSAETQLKSAQSQLEAVDANMAHVVIAATIDGVVARKWAMTGDVVQPAQAIYTLFDLKDLWVDANFKETQIRNLRIGDPVTISVDAYPELKLKGKIEKLGVTTAAQFALIPQDNTSGNYTKLTQRVPVRIALAVDQIGDTGESTKAALLPGMSVEVNVRTKGE